METTKYKILLIEDNKLDQMAFQRLVEDAKLPCDCTIADCVAKAKEILQTNRFDIIISDYSLGDGTAFEILSTEKDIPIIFVTGTGDEETAVKAWKAGAHDYLIKDIERNYLKAVPITIENVIKHKQIEEQVQLLSAAVMSTDDSVYITDTENRIIFVNRAFCKTYGYKKEEIVGQYSNILWIGNQNHTTRSVFQMPRSNWEIRFYHKRKDGSIMPVSLSRSIIKDPNGKNIAVVSVARDISEQIFTEDELRTLNQKMEEQNRSKSESAIEVCGQLTTLITEVKKIISNVMTSTPQAGNKLKLAEKDIDRASEIIKEFAETSQANISKMATAGSATVKQEGN